MSQTTKTILEKKTPLYDCHIKSGGKMVPFAGHTLPVQYTGVIEEHMAVRQAAGLFDVSHMGEFILSGPDALATLNHLFTNDFSNMSDGRVRYSVLCNEDGGIVDDMIVYRIAQDRYMVVPNADNVEKDYEWMHAHLVGDVELDNISDSVAQIALQGPKSRDILAKVCTGEHIPEKYYTFTERAVVAGVECILSQTGYTGEKGFELYCDPADAAALWDALLEAGSDQGLIPCGLGARDTLRLEAGMPLYGHEMNDAISPLETGLGFCVKMRKEDFIGKDAIVARGVPEVGRVGLRVTGRGIARENCAVLAGGERIGFTTSGTFLPYLNGAYAMALVDVRAVVGQQVEIDVRGRKVAAEIVPLPLYKRA